MSRRRVLVTGAAGFLGSHVVEQLSAAGHYDVVATDVVRSERAEALAALKHVEFLSMDLRDTAALDTAVSASDTVIHLAAVRTQASSTTPRAAHDVNVGAAYDLVSLSAQHGVERLVLGSTHSVYGPFDDPAAPPFTEDQASIRRGLSMYAASKLAAEAFAEAFAQAGGAPYVILRYGTIYGPRANRDSNAGILIDILDALDRGERPSVPWQRDAVHALVHVHDAALATLRAVEVAGVERTAVNVVGPPVTAEELYTELVRIHGGDPGAIEWRDERTRYQYVSAGRLASVLGLTATTDLLSGLREFVDWYREDVKGVDRAQ
ncbi:NAD-dependent epimerase/dehydratase family protein [Streptomyces sp. NBC_00391]|uniref:NAD-dependent epimerase/dehydratase family protein n=1 Tax=Streptomyces sp. NBC_00391 TaxID=2903647 RepID=UPI002E1D06A3